MRRLIAYITLALSMLLAIGVAATPVLTKLHNGREFSNGKEIVFKLDTEDENFNNNSADEIAKEMRTRLDNFSIEDYSVKVEGNGEVNDTVVASFAVEKDQFNYVAKYLAFSGNHFGISGELENTMHDEIDGHDIFLTEKAEIVLEQDTIPVIVLPVTSDGKADIENIIKTFDEGKEESGNTAKPIKKGLIREDEHDHDHEGEGGTEEKASPNLFLWANYEEGDSYDLASKDPLVRDKILMSFYSDSIWYEKAKEDEPAISFICATATEDNQLDLSGLKDDNVRAKYLLNMLQAKEYEVSISCPTRNVSESGVDYYENALDVQASAESLISFGNNINVAMSTTLIATFVAIVIVILLIVVYYRASALAMAATTLGTIFVTLISFKSMAVLFNLPAIIGLLALAGVSLFGQIFYVNRFKDEVYKGRSLKKANQEASKKSNLVTLDSAVISAFTGLMMYVLGGQSLKPLGVVLFFGGVFALLMNLIVFKILMYLLTNSTNLQGKYGVFNIDGEKVPNLLTSEAKPSYVSSYEKTDFTKKKKLSGIILGILALASVAVISVFGAIDGSPLNVKNATHDTTTIYTSLKVDNPIIENEEQYKEFVIKNVEEAADIKLSVESVEVKKVSVYEYDATLPETNENLYFITKASNTLSSEDIENLNIAFTNVFAEMSIDEDAVFNLNDYVISNEIKTSKELNYTPNQGLVALATGISIVGIALYASLRFRPAHGVSLLVTTTGATAIAYGVMVATRIGTTAITSLAMPLVAVSMMVASLFYFSTEKAMRKEQKDGLTLEVRKDIMKNAVSKSASPMLFFMLITIYIAINYFGFGLQQTAYLFASALLGEIVAVISLLTILGPLAMVFEKAFSKIHLPHLKIFERKEKTNVPQKRNSSEPEETIFIGIND